MELLEYEPLFQKYFDEHHEEFQTELKKIYSSFLKLDRDAQFNAFLSEHILKFLQINNITVVDVNLLKLIMIITETFYDEIR